MNFDEIVRMALDQKATDIHLEPRSPIVLRVNGNLRPTKTIVSPESLRTIADRLLPEGDWDAFQARGSSDLTRKIAGVPCRINVMKSDRGIGLAVRLLSASTNTLRSCNLHPQLGDFLERETGLILLTGPTGSGKSTTLSAMLEEINQQTTRHIITLESPIEYRLQPKKSLIRQREVGLHTPSYEQGLMDCLREDPDVIVVGEMRDAEAMRWTLNAAETGHLVIATMHSSNSADAVYRMMMSFPPERQSSVLAQLADSLIAIISQKMQYRVEARLLVPALEILVATHATKNVIRKGEVSKLQSLLQTGGPEGNWTFERYQQWLDSKTDWVMPEPPPLVSSEEDESPVTPVARIISAGAGKIAASALAAAQRRMPVPIEHDLATDFTAELPEDTPVIQTKPSELTTRRKRPTEGSVAMKIHKDGRIEIPDMDLDLNELVKEFKNRGEEI
jgi:twitching motility protein PilT